MDFWAKLIAGTSPTASNTAKAQAHDPEKRLLNFIREYDHLVKQIWRASSDLSKAQNTTKAARASIQNLTMILSDETRRPTPHVCITHTSTRQMYASVSKIAIMSRSEAVVREAVCFFTTLVDSEEEGFIKDGDFAKALTNLLLKATGVNSMGICPDAEVEILELAFGIAAKLRLQPEILPAWFKAHAVETKQHESSSAQERFAGKAQKDDFPLFYLLIDFIHHDGRIGDFARTGLLYLIEAASHSSTLEQWLIESDLATLMSTGLGALYSQLSRKLVIDYDPNDLPQVLLLSDYRRPDSNAEIISSASENFKVQMDTFLSHLMFWQDVLEHCRSAEVEQTLLEHFRVVFLQQLLYPSLLESSDVDGGSAVAVLTYLRRILETVTHFDMTRLILCYLLAVPDNPAHASISTSLVSGARKRKSLDLLTMAAAHDATPALFSLVDLLTSSLQSQSHQTVASALQLLSILLKCHHQHTSHALLKTSRRQADVLQRTIGEHERELEIILSLVGDLGLDHDVDDVYDNHLKDATTLVESHACSQRLLFPRGSDRSFGGDTLMAGTFEKVQVQTIRLDDPTLTSIIRVLGTFFVNPVEINLCATEVIIGLASCGLTDLLGWLLPDPVKYSYETNTPRGQSITLPNEQSLESAGQRDLQHARRMPTSVEEQPPRVLRSLRGLATQVSHYRTQILEFDRLVCDRRHQLQTDVQTTPNMRSATYQRTRSSAETHTLRAISPSPSRRLAFDQFVQRALPDFTSISRSNSPNGLPRTRQTQEPRMESSVLSRAVTAAVKPSIELGYQVANEKVAMTHIEEITPQMLSEATTQGSRSDHSKVETHTILQEKLGMRSMASLLIVPSASDFKGHFEGSPIHDTPPKQETPEGNCGGGDVVVSAAVHEEDQSTKVTVSHVLTNVVIFQEFLLELAALLQVRAGLFGEVRFA